MFLGILTEDSQGCVDNLSPTVVFDLIGDFVDETTNGNNEKTQNICEEISNALNKELLNSSNGVKRLQSLESNTHEKETLLTAPVSIASQDGNKNTIGFEDAYMGISSKGGANTNETVTAESLQAQMKKRQQERKARELALRRMAEWEMQKPPPPSPVKRHVIYGQNTSKVVDVIVDKFTVGVSGRSLLDDATLRITVGKKYGLIGRNGIGKTVFLHAVARHEIHGIPKHVTIASVEQESHHLCSGENESRSVVDLVLDVDAERRELLSEVEKIQKSTGSAAENIRLDECFSRLEEINASAAEAQVRQILSGLGLTEIMQNNPLKNLSGGWRMRVLLARALFAEADFLLLDEPTNHLDLHAVAWLVTNF
jgi:ATP-binding cassette subfamily F protein 3